MSVVQQGERVDDDTYSIPSPPPYDAADVGIHYPLDAVLQAPTLAGMKLDKAIH